MNNKFQKRPKSRKSAKPGLPASITPQGQSGIGKNASLKTLVPHLSQIPALSQVNYVSSNYQLNGQLIVEILIDPKSRLVQKISVRRN